MTTKMAVKLGDVLLWLVTGSLYAMLLLIFAIAMYMIGIGLGESR